MTRTAIMPTRSGSGGAAVVHVVTVITGVVVGLTFLVGFGNVLNLALRLGVPVWVAPPVAPAVDLGQPQLQTLMYLMLSVAGHLTIFLARTRGPFWSIRPARILLLAVLGTQALATLIAAYGLFMTALGWRWAGFVWGYAIIWALLGDRVKLLAYRVLDAPPAHHHSRQQAHHNRDRTPLLNRRGAPRQP